MSRRAGRASGAADRQQQPLLFFSTRQGRQSNCVLTVEVVRFLAERFGRQLVLPPCHTSPLGEQACAARPDLPPQRQILVPFALSKILQPRDLARCWATAGWAPPLLSPIDLPVQAEPRNVTCVEIVEHTASRPRARNPCEDELREDMELRSQLALRFVRHVTISARDMARVGASTGYAPASSASGQATASRTLYSRLVGGGGGGGGGGVPSSAFSTPSTAFYVFDTLLRASVRLPDGDLYINGAFSLFTRGILTKALAKPYFGLCTLPRETQDVEAMEGQLHRALGFARRKTLCVHWRGEDFHHPHILARHRQNGSATVAAAHAIRLARRLSASSVLVLSNARFEALDELLGRMRADGLRASSPRELGGTAFACDSSFVYGVAAEMLTCSRAQHFLGSPRSSFSSHIVAMRSRGALNGTVSWMHLDGASRNGDREFEIDPHRIKTMSL